MASTKNSKQKKESSSAETKWSQRARAEPVTVQYLMQTLQELFARALNLISIYFLGCSLASAVVCALVKATGKLVTIAKDNVSYDLQTIDVWYQTLEA